MPYTNNHINYFKFTRLQILVSLLLLLLLANFKAFASEGSNEITKEELKLFTDVKSLLAKSFEDGSTTTFSGKGDELDLFAKAFLICNRKVYLSEPLAEKFSRILIQESLYGYPRVVDSRVFYKTAIKAERFPALDTGISKVILAMVSPTAIQKSIYKKDLKYFKSSNDYKEFTNYIHAKDIHEKELEKINLVKSFSGVCSHSDLYMGLFDYSNVGEYETISWKAAQKMLRVNTDKALTKTKEKYTN